MSNEHLEDKITELRRTLSWMDLVMANINECILILDKDWRIVFINSYMAELIDQNRIVLLGKYIWEIPPFDSTLSTTNFSQKPIQSISKFNGVYDLRIKSVNLKLMLRGKYVGHLQQAVCIISDVSVELNTASELMKLHKKIAKLEAELSKK